MNVDSDALSCILKGENDHHMEADLVHALISQLAQDTTPMEV